MRKFAVIELGRFGRKVAEMLAKKNACNCYCSKPELIAKVGDFVTKAVQMDSTNEKLLIATGIKNVDVASNYKIQEGVRFVVIGNSKNFESFEK
jgi:trk/ktr system potassium uptake protein